MSLGLDAVGAQKKGQREEDWDSRKIIVVGLKKEWDDEKLRLICESHGNVERANIVRDKMSDQSRGFGFVTFNTVAEQKAAIRALNQMKMSGRTLNVRAVEEKDDYAKRRGPAVNLCRVSEPFQ